MPRNLNAALKAELAKGSVRPFYLCDLTLKSGVQRIGTHVGPLVWNGNTYSGLGELAEVGAIHESSGVQADGTTIALNVAPSQIAIPGPPTTPPAPPYAVPAGQNFAWAFATKPPARVEFHDPASVFNNFNGCSGVGEGNTYSGTASVLNGDSIEANSITIQWSGYRRPLEVPAGARIVAVYPYAIAAEVPNQGAVSLTYSTAGGSSSFTTLGSGLVGVNVDTFDVNVTGFVEQTLPAALGNCSLSVSYVALAVYYEGTPLTTTSLLYEAMSDVRVGAPVKLWFGMLSAAGAIVGSPFLAFSGLVDEPSITEDPAGTKIVLALESRLRNHARAGGRRYTAADQKLDFPNDSGFNSVEALEEVSLKWG